MNMPQVFLSYATENQKVVDTYVAELQRLGIDVWIDHMKIDHGDSIVELLNKAIDECKIAVVFYSEAYARKPWTNEEQKMLLYQFVESNREGTEDRTILVIKLDNTPLPPMLGHRLWCGSDNVATVALSIAERIGQEPISKPAIEESLITAIPTQLDGVSLEQLATQLVEPIQEVPASQTPICLPVFVKGYRKVVVECMPSPACDGVVEEIAACLYRCNAHRRHIGAHQKNLSRNGLGIFDEAFRMALDEQIEMLDQVRFGTSKQPGLCEFLDSLILAVYEEKT